MKSSFVEISLSELRNFITTIDETYATQLSSLSLVALKLRLQFIISQKQFKDFNSFNNHIKENEDFRNSVFSKINSLSNELFRDAEGWDYFCKELIKITENKTIDICLFESGNFSDSITLLICLQEYNLADKCHLTIVDLINRNNLQNSYPFDAKEMEMGILNFSALKLNTRFENYFTKKDKESIYHIPNFINTSFTNLSDFENSTAEYDALIARNLTLNKNFTAHENLFQLYLKTIKPSGILFTGNKEGFKWCKNFESLNYQNKIAPVYYKK
jgi:chemotaxis methyl-accepting protein methylase